MTSRETSLDALNDTRPRMVSMKQRIYNFIASNKGVIAEFIAIELGMSRSSTVAARVGDLEKEGRIQHNGRYGTTTSGCRAMEWEIVPAVQMAA